MCHFYSLPLPHVLLLLPISTTIISTSMAAYEATCPPNFSGYKSMPGCTSYFICSNGSVVLTSTCGTGTIFNENIGVCDLISNYNGFQCTTTAPPTIAPTISPKPSYRPSVSPSNSPTTKAPVVYDDITNISFCADDFTDIADTCRIGSWCPSGDSSECPNGQSCFIVAINGCNIRDFTNYKEENNGQEIYSSQHLLMPEGGLVGHVDVIKPTSSPTNKPTATPITESPITSSPSISPTLPLKWYADYNSNWSTGTCTTDWWVTLSPNMVGSVEDALNGKKYYLSGEECCADVYGHQASNACLNGLTVSPTNGPSVSPSFRPTDGPSTAYPTRSPVTNEPTLEPSTQPPYTSKPTFPPITMSPIAKPPASWGSPILETTQTEAPISSKPTGPKDFTQSNVIPPTTNPPSSKPTMYTLSPDEVQHRFSTPNNYCATSVSEIMSSCSFTLQTCNPGDLMLCPSGTMCFAGLHCPNPNETEAPSVSPTKKETLEPTSQPVHRLTLGPTSEPPVVIITRSPTIKPTKEIENLLTSTEPMTTESPSSLSPTPPPTNQPTPRMTPQPIITTNEPTVHNDLDMSSTYWCGTDRMNAGLTCHKRCRIDSECDEGETCYGYTSCEGAEAPLSPSTAVDMIKDMIKQPTNPPSKQPVQTQTPPPIEETDDAYTLECSQLCLQAISTFDCQYLPPTELSPCTGPTSASVKVGDLCIGTGECDTDMGLNNCANDHDIYFKLQPYKCFEHGFVFGYGVLPPPDDNKKTNEEVVETDEEVASDNDLGNPLSFISLTQNSSLRDEETAIDESSDYDSISWPSDDDESDPFKDLTDDEVERLKDLLQDNNNDQQQQQQQGGFSYQNDQGMGSWWMLRENHASRRGDTGSWKIFIIASSLLGAVSSCMI